MPAQDNPQNSPNLADIWLCASHATVFSGCATCKTHCHMQVMQTLSGSAVLRRLAEVQSFVRSQQGLPLGEDFLQTLVSGQVTSMVRLFKQIQSPSLEDATRLVNLLQTGPWSDEDTQRMVLAVSQMVVTPSKLWPLRLQNCPHLHAYMTQSEWSRLGDQSQSRICRVQVVVSRMVLLGLVRPNEQTRKHAAGLVAMFDEGPLGKSLCDDIKYWLKQHRDVSTADIAPLMDWPQSPNELPQATFARAYANEPPAPPGYVDLGRLQQVLPQLALRKSHHSCKEVSAPSSSAGGGGGGRGGGGGGGDISTSLLSAILSMTNWRDVLQSQPPLLPLAPPPSPSPHAPEKQAPSPSLEQPSPPAKSIVPRDLNQPSPPAKTIVLGDSTADSADEHDSFASMTAIMREAASMKGVKKRPAAAAFVAEEMPMKRPAGAKAKPDTLHYKGARIYTSDLKQGYRVMMPGEKKVDVLFKWACHASKEACLAAIKRVVDGK